MEQTRLGDIAKLIVCLVVCQLAGFIGSLFTTPSIPTWYALLKKPVFTPPNSVFAPVWTILFILMGIAAFLVWRKGFQHEGVKLGLVLFSVQLVLNVVWSYLFFGIHSPRSAFVEIVFLWTAIAATMVVFLRVSTIAGLLLVPYLAWVTFASVLNFSIVRLNP